MPRGGARPNSGPAKGTKYGPHKETISKEQGRAVVRQMVLDRLGPLVEAQVSNANGLKYLVGREKKTGKFVRLKQEQVEAVLSGEDDQYAYLEVWEKDPSVQAFTDLLNRALDKPKEQAQEINLTVELAAMSDRLLNARKRRALKSGKP